MKIEIPCEGCLHAKVCKFRVEQLEVIDEIKRVISSNDCIEIEIKCKSYYKEVLRR